MQTVNFQCGACGKLMAVGVEFLGQQVRCPHCQQVVIAPAASAPAPAPGSAGASPSQPAPEPFTLPQVHTDHDDIFTQRTEPEDALFGHVEGPRLEIPHAPEPAPSPPLELLSPTPAHVNGGLTEQPVLPFPDANAAVSPLPSAFTAPAPVSESPPWSPADSPSELPRESSATAARLRREQEGKGTAGMGFILLVFLPVLLWALGATVIGVWLYVEWQAARNRGSIWDEIPDAAGDTPGIRPAEPKKKVSYQLNFDRRTATQPLPDQLKVKLGDTIQVGDLEVTPIKVMRQKMSIMVQGYSRAEPTEHESLVLYMKMRSLATDYAFTPLDNYFDRQWKGAGPAPLTVLQAGKKDFFGGPVPWISQTQARTKNSKRQWLEGRKNVDRTGLLPGGDPVESFICTDGTSAETADYLFGRQINGRRVGGYHGPLLWRVHLRRGKIIRNGRPYSATAVIGVEFTDKDYAG
jgi:hypothetical protein